MDVSELNRYDRQIRAWGFETQRRLKVCKLLIIGFNHASMECIKNLSLAGACLIHVSDANIDLSCDQSFSYLQNLNPLCPVSEIKIDSLDFTQYDIIGTFNADVPIVETVKKLKSVIIVSNGINSDLIYEKEDYSPSQPTETCDALQQTIIGGLISQMIVDNLPPHDKPIGLTLKFDKNTMASSVTNISI